MYYSLLRLYCSKRVEEKELEKAVDKGWINEVEKIEIINYANNKN